MITENDAACRRRLNWDRIATDAYLTGEADPDRGSHAPHKRPPGAVWLGSQDGAFLLYRQIPSGLGSHVEFAVGLVSVVVKPQFLNVAVSGLEGFNMFGGKESRQTLLPELVVSLHFALGLGSWGVAEGDAVEMQSPAQGGECLGDGAEEEAVEIDVENQGQSVGGEGLGQEVVVGWQDFAVVDFGAGENPTAVINQVEHRENLLRVRKIGVRRGIQLPEFADLAALPAANRRGSLGDLGRRGQFVLDGPSPDLGAVEFKVIQAEGFAGSEAVG